jgi:hypothetical protein
MGCAKSDDVATPTTTSTVAAGDYDLARLSELSDDFPPDFVPLNPEVQKVHPVYVAGVGAAVSGGKPFTTDPQQCSILLKPVNGVAGSDSIGIRADAFGDRSISVGAYVPVAVSGDIPATGCDHMTYEVRDAERIRTGTAERIAAPAIDGATTVAVKITTDNYPDPVYFYAAVFDDRAYVNVSAQVARDFQAQPVLPDLLVKAVNAIRGQ